MNRHTNEAAAKKGPEMGRNGRYRCEQIDAAGGVHTTAADEVHFSP